MNAIPCGCNTKWTGWLYGWYLYIYPTFIYLTHFLSIYLILTTQNYINSLDILFSPFFNIINIIKNVSSSTETVKLWNYGILAFLFLAHSFMNRLKFQNPLFLQYLFKTFQECQQYTDTNISLNDVWPQRSHKVK